MALLVMALGAMTGAMADEAASDKAAKARAAFDRMDREDFLDGIEAANACIARRHFPCAEKQLKDIRELANGSADELLLTMATNNLRAEQQRVEAEERARREQQEYERRQEEARLAAEREQERREEAARRAEAAEQTRKAWMAGIGSVAIAAGGRNLSTEQRSSLMDAYVDDVMNDRGGSSFQAKSNEIMAQRQREFEASQRRLQAEREAARQREQAAMQRALDEQRARDAQRQQQVAVAQQQAAQVAAQQRQAEDSRRMEAERLQREQDRQRQLAEAQAAREAEQRRQEVERQQREQERQQRLAQEKAEREAKKAAEAAEAERAKREYLQAMTTGISLRARTCPGPDYYIVGNRPRIKPEVVSCIDVRYGTRCPGEQRYTEDVGRNFIGISTDCYMGDTYKIPKLSCPADQVQVKVLEVTPCR